MSEECTFSYCSPFLLSRLAELILQLERGDYPVKIVGSPLMQSIFRRQSPIAKRGSSLLPSYLLVPTWHFPGHIYRSERQGCSQMWPALHSFPLYHNDLGVGNHTEILHKLTGPQEAKFLSAELASSWQMLDKC